MIYAYVFSLILGGLLLGGNLLLGGKEGEVGDHHDGETSASQDDGLKGTSNPLVFRFFSFRFWVFFLCFFGLTGLSLRGIGVSESEVVSAIASFGVGGFAGFFANWLYRVLNSSSANSAIEASDYIGKTGRLLVGFGAGEVGKVRVEIKGATIDLLCTGLDEGAYQAKEEVMIVEMEGLRAKVARVNPGEEKRKTSGLA
ncbi:MAG: hypothetical protein NZM37_06515 [Sandaracinaceae bacterium]|nr:hypothetical protein [Sandaracinaceae bacterium]